MTPLEILIEARDLISAPERWTKGTSARAEDGEEVAYWGTRAVCWCSDGALMKVSGYIYDAGEEGSPEASDYWAAFKLLDDLSPGNGFIDFNDKDDRIHSEVIELFDRAIAAASTVTEPQP